MRWTSTGHILVLLMKSCRKGAGLRRERERERHQINNYWCYFFPILLFWQKTNFLPSSFWHRVLLNLNLLGRNGKTSMDVQWEQSCWSRDDSISFHSMAMLIPSNQFAKKSNHHPRFPEAAYSMCRSDFKANVISVTPFPLLLYLSYIYYTNCL